MAKSQSNTMDYLPRQLTSPPTPSFNLYTHIVYRLVNGTRIETHHFGEAAAQREYNRLFASGYTPHIEPVIKDTLAIHQPNESEIVYGQ